MIIDNTVGGTITSEKQPGSGAVCADTDDAGRRPTMRAVDLQLLSIFTDRAAGQGQKSSPKKLARLSILGLDSHAAWPVCARHHRCVGVALDTRFLR